MKGLTLSNKMFPLVKTVVKIAFLPITSVLWHWIDYIHWCCWKEHNKESWFQVFFKIFRYKRTDVTMETTLFQWQSQGTRLRQSSWIYERHRDTQYAYISNRAHSTISILSFSRRNTSFCEMRCRDATQKPSSSNSVPAESTIIFKVCQQTKHISHWLKTFKGLAAHILYCS